MRVQEHTKKEQKHKRGSDTDGLEEASGGGVALEALGTVEADDVGDARRTDGSRSAREHGAAKERRGREDVRHARGRGGGGCAHGADEGGRGLGRREARRGGGEDVAGRVGGAVEALGREECEGLQPGDGACGGHGTRRRAHLRGVAHHNTAHRSVRNEVFFFSGKRGLAAEHRRRHRKHRRKRTRDRGRLDEVELCEFSDGSDVERVELEKALKERSRKVDEEEELCEFSDGSDVERIEMENALEEEQQKVRDEELCEFSDGSDVERIEMEKELEQRAEKKKTKKREKHRNRHKDKDKTQHATSECERQEPSCAATPQDKKEEASVVDESRKSVSILRQMFEEMSRSQADAGPGPARRQRQAASGLRTSLHVYRRIEEEERHKKEQHM